MMGMGRLYQKLSVSLVLVFSIIFAFSTNRSALAYNTSLCDGNNDGVSECSPGQACTKSGSITFSPYECRNVSNACSPACSAGQVCADYQFGQACREGQIITSSGRDVCNPNPCPAGTYCSINNGSVSCDTTPQASQGTSAPLGVDQLITFWQQGHAKDPTAFGRLTEILYKIILPIAVVLGMLFVAAAGYALMTSQGDPERTMEAKEKLTSAIMGLLFVLLGVGILRVIISTLIEGTDPGF